MNIIYKIPIFVLIILLYSCTNFDNSSIAEQNIRFKREINANNSILLLDLQIEYDSLDAHSSIKSSEIKILPGQLKKATDSNDFLLNSSSLKIEFLDDNDNILKTKIVRHPLFKTIEGINGATNTLETSKIVLKKTGFIIRTNYNPNYNKVKIFETIDAQEMKFIYQISLPK
jgi:hypothetical protein